MGESKINVTEWNQTENVDIKIPIIWVVAKNSKEKNEICIAFPNSTTRERSQNKPMVYLIFKA